jgi:hypothetical protein
VLSDTNQTARDFIFNVTQPGEAWVGVAFYNRRMYPSGCKVGYTAGQAKLYKDGVYIQSLRLDDVYYNKLYFANLSTGSYVLNA